MAVEPVDVTVPEGATVRVHVARRPLSGRQQVSAVPNAATAKARHAAPHIQRGQPAAAHSHHCREPSLYLAKVYRDTAVSSNGYNSSDERDDDDDDDEVLSSPTVDYRTLRSSHRATHPEHTVGRDGRRLHAEASTRHRHEMPTHAPRHPSHHHYHRHLHDEPTTDDYLPGPDASIAEVRSTIRQMQAKAASDKAALKQALRDAKQRLRQASDTIDTLRAEQSRTENRLRSSEQQMQELRANEAQLQQRLRRATDGYDAAEDELDNRTETARRLTSQVHALQAALDAKAEELQRMAAELRDVQDQYREQAAEARRSAGAVTDLRQQVESLQSQIQTSQQEARTLVEERRQFEEMRWQAERQRQEEDQQRDAEIAALREQLEQALTAKRNLETYVSYIKTTYKAVFEEETAAGQ